MNLSLLDRVVETGVRLYAEGENSSTVWQFVDRKLHQIQASDQPFAEFNLARDTAYTRLISMGVMDQEPTWTEILDSINSMLDREKV